MSTQLDLFWANVHVRLYLPGAYMNVAIRVVNGLEFDMDITPSQMKIVFLSQVKNVAGATVAYAPYIADQFYHGHSVSSLCRSFFLAFCRFFWLFRLALLLVVPFSHYIIYTLLL
jgi:hypothetical protein